MRGPAVCDGGTLVDTPLAPTCEVCVCIPVRDEANALGGALTALAQQVDWTGRPVDFSRYELIVLANNCSDDSAAVARMTAGRFAGLRFHLVELALPTPHANIGTARRLLMDEAARRLIKSRASRPIIATTDGDTRVERTWLQATLDEFGRGVDAVAGRILIDPIEGAALDADARERLLRDEAYRLAGAELESLLAPCDHDPWPRHHQHFHASFGVTAAVYRQAGGIPAVPDMEDVAFVRALHRIDAGIRHSLAVRVYTSARTEGRVARGLSHQIRLWIDEAHSACEQEVDAASLLADWFAARAAARSLWLGGLSGGARVSALQTLAKSANIDNQLVLQALREAASFGLFCERLDLWSALWAQTPESKRTEPVEAATHRLREMIRRARRGLLPLEHIEPVLRLPSAAERPQLGTF